MVKIEKELILNGINDIDNSEKIENELNKIKGVEAYINIASGRAIIIYKNKPEKWEQIQNKFKKNGIDFYECPNEPDTIDDEPEELSFAAERCNPDIDSGNSRQNILQSNTRLGFSALLFSKNSLDLLIEIIDVICEKEITAQQIIYYAGSALCTFNSPISMEIIRLCEFNSVKTDIPNSVSVSEERGLTAELKDQTVLVGNFEFMVGKSINIIGIEETQSGRYPIYVAVDGYLLGAVIVRPL